MGSKNQRELIDQRRDDLNAGVADENVERAECLNHPNGPAPHPPSASDTHPNADAALPAGIDLASRCISRFLIEICNRDLRTLAGKNNGDVLAYPTGSAGDDGNLILETHVNL